MRSEPVVLDPSGERSGVRIMRAVRRSPLQILALALLGGLLGLVISAVLPASYTARSVVYLGAAAPFDPTGSAASVEPTRFATDQAGLMTTTDVLGNAGGRMTPPLPMPEVAASVTALSTPAGNSVVVSAVRPDPVQAAQLADAVVAAYRARSLERVSDAAYLASQSMEDRNLRGQIALRTAGYGDGVSDVEPAAPPAAPSSPLPVRNALIAALLGLLAGLGLALAREHRYAARATVADLELLLGAPFVGRVRRPDGPSFVPDPASDHGPEQEVLAAIDMMLAPDRSRSVLFLSWQRGLTQTALVASTGFAAARLGTRVVLVDGGGKARGLTHISALGPRGRGVDGVAERPREMAATMHTWQVEDASVGLVPLPQEGPGAGGGAVRPQSLGAAVGRLRDTAGLVLVDGPLLTDRSLGFTLGRGVDGVLLVIDEATSIDDAHEMARRVALSGVRLIGFVAVGGRPAHPARPATWLPSRRDGEGPVSLDPVSSTARHP